MDFIRNCFKYHHFHAYPCFYTKRRRSLSDILWHACIEQIQIATRPRDVIFAPTLDVNLGEAAFFSNSLEALGREAPEVPIMVGQTNMDAAVFFFLCP